MGRASTRKVHLNWKDSFPVNRHELCTCVLLIYSYYTGTLTDKLCCCWFGTFAIYLNDTSLIVVIQMLRSYLVDKKQVVLFQCTISMTIIWCHWHDHKSQNSLVTCLSFLSICWNCLQFLLEFTHDSPALGPWVLLLNSPYTLVGGIHLHSTE